MPHPDTSLGGPRGTFPSTFWSDLLEAGDASVPEQRAKLDRLLQTYWKPVYVYIRSGWHKSVEDAKDLTQSFFAHMMEKGYFAQIRPERGTFRAYLKTALKHFLINAEEYESIRRPPEPVVRLDARDEDWSDLGPASPDESPEAAYDREWFQGMIEEATETLKETLRLESKEEYFTIFQRYCMGREDTTYRQVGDVHGLKEGDVRHRLEYVRAVLKRILRAQIREYVSSDDEIEPELRKALNE